MDWKQQFKVHDLSFRETIIILLVVAVCEVILLLISSGPNPKAVSRAYRANCAANQRQIYELMCEVSGEEGFELPPEWTVADLIREAAGKTVNRPIPLLKKILSVGMSAMNACFLFDVGAWKSTSLIWCFPRPPRSCSTNLFRSPFRSSCVPRRAWRQTRLDGPLLRWLPKRSVHGRSGKARRRKVARPA